MEVLPSLARAAEARSFDSSVWPEGTRADGLAILIGGRDCGELIDVPADFVSPSRIVVTRVGRLVRSGPLVLCDVDASLSARGVLADVAWPGTHLAGARMRQLLVRGADGTRMAGVVEVPADVAVDAVIALAVTTIGTTAGAPSEGISSPCVQCDDTVAGERWTVVNPLDYRRSHDIYRRTAG